ncbi:MAG: TetR/AcrR family transcriptional regulator [Deltaproteobacteria bacterium]|nr:TetR/AcrR family transcriptional regulator [Deltaproteobacteria bacterium]
MPRRAPPKPARVRRTPEAARALILDAARELIAERGPDAVGLKDIGARAGVSHTLVVHYFGGYEPLVQEVLRAGVERFRTLMLSRVTADAAVDPAAWMGLVFDELRASTTGRLVLWALLTRRLEGPDAFFRQEQGLRLVCDALETKLRQVFGAAAPDRVTLEATLVLGIAASWGYALGGDALWGALGHDPDPDRDADARDRLGRALLQSALTPPRR